MSAARLQIIAAHLPLPTPLVHSVALSERWDAHVSLKLECVTPTSAFKVRGGVNLVSRLSADELNRGLVTSSTGNHGQSIAFAAASVGATATIFMPTDANVDKIAAIERLGGMVELVGERFDEARVRAEEFAAERGARYVEPVEEPLLIAGVATAALEVLEDQQPDTELVILRSAAAPALQAGSPSATACNIPPRSGRLNPLSRLPPTTPGAPGNCRPGPTPASPKASRRPSRSRSRSTSCAGASTTSCSPMTLRSSRRSDCSGTPNTSWPSRLAPSASPPPSSSVNVFGASESWS